MSEEAYFLDELCKGLLEDLLGGQLAHQLLNDLVHLFQTTKVKWSILSLEAA